MRSPYLLLAVCLTGAGSAGAQLASKAGIDAIALERDTLVAPASLRWQAPAPRTPSAWAVASSLILPGAGQALLRQERSVPYIAVEAFFLARYVRHSRDARRERDRYRSLAANVARSPFGAAAEHGTFAYYESMEHFVESGVFDAVPGGELDPEPDTTTFNGRTWLLARQTFWRDVSSAPPRDSREWRLAESFYQNRAVRPEFRWSWRDAQLEYDEFRRTIRRSNDAFRDAVTDLSVIIANHVLSGVDALVSVRLRSSHSSGNGRGLSIRAELPMR